MPAGYAMPTPAPGDTLADLREGFAWSLPERYNVADVTADAAEPADTALRHVDDDGRTHAFAYAELDRAAALLAGHLADAGIARGDRVVLCVPQSPELLVAHLAVYRLGAVAVPLSVLLGGDSFAHSLEHSGATGLLVESAAAERFADEIRARDLAVENLVALDGAAYDRDALVEADCRALGVLADVVGVTDGADGDADVPDPRGVADTAPDDLALVLYTSGTTGKPKGVAQAHQYLAGSLPGYQCWFHLFGDTHRERVWTPAGWAWAGALFDVVFPTLATGGVVVSSVRRSGFDPERALGLVEREAVSRAFLPPTAVWQVREQVDPSAYDLSALEVVMCGGESLSPSVFEWAEDALDATVNETYGQTEANALVGNCQVVFDAEPGSMGKPYPGHDVRLVDAEGAPVEVGETGEVVLRAPDPVLFEGYWDDEAATEAVFDGEWYATGDLARRDNEGYLHFRGRADDLVVTAGYRVNPTEVEEALRRSPAVSAAVVGGVPDEERGQRVKAYVVPAADAEPGDALAAELRDLVADTAGRHKVPREFEFLTEPPETRTGKVDRSALFPRD